MVKRYLLNQKQEGAEALGRLVEIILRRHPTPKERFFQTFSELDRDGFEQFRTIRSTQPTDTTILILT